MGTNDLSLNFMSSRERLLTTMAHKELDHVPLFLKRWLRPFLRSPSAPFRDQFHRVEESLKLGLDDAVTYEVPRPRDERTGARVEKRLLPGERYPVLFKEYETPKGTLTQIVRQTDDWKLGMRFRSSTTRSCRGAESRRESGYLPYPPCKGTLVNSVAISR